MEAVKPKFMALSTLDAPTAKCPSTAYLIPLCLSGLTLYTLLIQRVKVNNIVNSLILIVVISSDMSF